MGGVKSCRVGMVPIILLGSFPFPKSAKCSKEGSILHIFPLLCWGQVVVSYKGRRKQCLKFDQMIRMLTLADIDPCLSILFGMMELLWLKLYPAAHEGVISVTVMHCGRFWWKGNSSNASISLRWGLASASVLTLDVSKTLCCVVWYQRVYWWCKAHDKSKVSAVTDHCHCIYLLWRDWDSWARLCCHYLQLCIEVAQYNQVLLLWKSFDDGI